MLALVSYQNGHVFCLCLASPRRCDRDPCVRQHVLAEPCHVNASCHHAALPGTYERLLVAVEQQFHNMSQQCELGYDGRLRCGSHYYTRHVFRYTFRYARVGFSSPPPILYQDYHMLS